MERHSTRSDLLGWPSELYLCGFLICVHADADQQSSGVSTRLLRLSPRAPLSALKSKMAPLDLGPAKRVSPQPCDGWHPGRAAVFHHSPDPATLVAGRLGRISGFLCAPGPDCPSSDLPDLLQIRTSRG